MPSVKAATAGMRRWKCRSPRRGTCPRPRCLPSPIAIILSRPLSTGPGEVGVRLDPVDRDDDVRLLERVAVDEHRDAVLDRRRSGRCPCSSGSRSRSIAAVIPSEARTASCPSAVAPPWLPIAGMANDVQRHARGARRTVARATSAIRSMPRLPSGDATRARRGQEASPRRRLHRPRPRRRRRSRCGRCAGATAPTRQPVVAEDRQRVGRGRCRRGRGVVLERAHVGHQIVIALNPPSTRTMEPVT